MINDNYLATSEFELQALESEPTQTSNVVDFAPDRLEVDEASSANPIDFNDDDTGTDTPRASQSTLLVELALANYELGVTDSGEVFAVERDGPNIALQLRGGRTSLGMALAAHFFYRYGKAPSSTARAEALTVLEGIAAQYEPVELPLRVGRHGNNLVLDLGTPSGEAVCITAKGWSVVHRSPVLFKRTNLTVPLPHPTRTTKPILDLLGIFNANESQRQFMTGWLLAALFPDIPHPILALYGLQGTGKSVAGGLLGRIVDPTSAPLRSSPRNEDTWATAAAGSWIVVLDNLSTIPHWLSDALCRAVTGDGLVKRQLYTDSDVAVLKFRRCIALTAIDTGALRGDLAERLLPIELERIDAKTRRPEAELLNNFHAVHGEILGALLDVCVQVMGQLPQVDLNELPRMADFAKLLAALDRVTGWNTLERYLNVGSTLAQDVIDSDPVALAVVTLAHEEQQWSGTATDLLERITNLDKAIPKGWPTQPNVLTGRLKRIAPALREVGVIAEQGRGQARRQWQIEFIGKPSSPSSSSSLPCNSKAET